MNALLPYLTPMSIEGGRKEETDPAIARVSSPYLRCLEDEAPVRLFVGQPSRCLLATAPIPAQRR